MRSFWVRPLAAKFQFGDKVQATTYAKIRMSAGYVGKLDSRDLLTITAPGDVLTVQNGSSEVDGLTWWFVKTKRGEFGWMAECAPDGTTLMAPYDDTNWGRSIAFVLSAEGGLSTDPNDYGGTTKYGIS